MEETPSRGRKKDTWQQDVGAKGSAKKKKGKSKSPSRAKKVKNTNSNNADGSIARRKKKVLSVDSEDNNSSELTQKSRKVKSGKSPKSPNAIAKKKKKAGLASTGKGGKKLRGPIYNEQGSQGSFRIKGPSVTKTLTRLLKTASNKSCADCRSALVDPSEVYASFCPSGKNIHLTPEVAVAFHDFQLTHHAFAPPEIKDDPVKFGADPSMFVNQRYGGHGVFICSKCAQAHKKLGKTITVVQPLQDSSVWTGDQATFMQTSGGNARSWLVYEAYLPEGWKDKRPSPSSSLAERVIFCRAKYEALAFVMPPPGPLSEPAWISILERSEAVKRFANGDLRNIHSLTPADKVSQENKHDIIGSERELPNRLIDFFCVVNSSMQLHPKDLGQDLSKLNSPEEVNFWPQVCDCFPLRTAHSDMEFPEHLPSFMMPDGCKPSMTQKPPSFFTFVLTLGDGDRLYGGVLQIYDDSIEIEELRDVIKRSGYEGKMPQFLFDEDDDGSDIVFLPKCLVILSHHPFYDLFRESLLQIYRITFVEAPLPIERYIANIVCEVPLPPQGKIKIDFGFTTERILTIQRPPANRLPMANFSYRPLFSSLSVGNILVVMGCLMEECKVAVLSQYRSLLCPACEALLSVLFPFEWQGLYIPVMPTSMAEILDAPVPFLVGMDARYFYQIDPMKRQSNVVYVDLDRDMVYLGYDEITGKKREIPALPPRDAIKLKAALDNAASSVYLIPNNGIKGCVMAGKTKMSLVANEDRPKYAQMSTIVLDGESFGRKDIFSMADKAYDDSDLSDAYSKFQTEYGLMKDDTDSDSSSSGSSGGKRMFPRMRRPKFLRNKKSSDTLSENKTARSQGHLLDLDEPEGFSSSEIRNYFLRFFVTIFLNYERYLVESNDRQLFNTKEFLDNLGLDHDARNFMRKALETQMFQRFLEERKDNPDDPEILFFDESIIAKLNRSKATTLTTGGKKKTPFLDDDSWKITKTFTPPPPNNLGLSSDITYQYESFPSLDLSKVGRIRQSMMWSQRHSSRESMKFKAAKSTKVRKTQQEIVKKAMKPLASTTGGAIAAAARRSARDLESALAMMSPGSRHRKTMDKKNGPNEKMVSLDESVKTASSDDSMGNGDRSVNTLSRADIIMINARRKQGILLDLVIDIQAVCRMYLARNRYLKFRKSLIRLQNQQRRICSTPRVEEQTNYFKRQLRRATAVQKYVRGYLAKLEAKRRIEAIISIQSKQRSQSILRKYNKTRESAIVIQSAVKARRTRYIFCLVRSIISKVQARARGMWVRKRFAQIFEARMLRYREQIFLLWNKANVSLSLRTKLWPTISTGQGFSRLRFAEAELWRLWKAMGLKDDAKARIFFDKTTKLSDVLGICNHTYQTCYVSKQRVSDIAMSDSLPRVGSLEAVEAERLQIYDRLDNPKIVQNIGGLYKSFDIPSNEKMKKLHLANSIWTQWKYSEESFSVMMQIFPELVSSLNIAFHNPSRKGKGRFPKAQKVFAPPVEKSLWDEISLEEKMKKHVQEVASIYITKVPSLSAKLDEAEERRQSEWKSLQAAIFKDSNGATLKILRLKLINQFLAGRYSTKGSPIEESKREPARKTIGGSPDQQKTPDSPDQQKTSDSSNPFDDDNVPTIGNPVVATIDEGKSNNNPFEGDSVSNADSRYANLSDEQQSQNEYKLSTNPFEESDKTTDCEVITTSPFESNRIGYEV